MDKTSVKNGDTVTVLEVEDERAVALRLARAADPGPAVFSLRGIQFVFYALVICACSGDTGFDGTIMSAVNSMEQFHRFFGFDPKTGAAKTGIVFVSIVMESDRTSPQSESPEKQSDLAVLWSSPASPFSRTWQSS